MRLKDILENEIPNEFWDAVTNATEKEALEMVKKSWEKFCPKTINTGFCDIFAYNMKKKLPEIELFSTEESDGSGTFGHVIFKYKNKFYDAETKNGVSNTNQIPYSKRVFKLTGEYPKYEKI